MHHKGVTRWDNHDQSRPAMRLMPLRDEAVRYMRMPRHGIHGATPHLEPSVRDQ